MPKLTSIAIVLAIAACLAAPARADDAGSDEAAVLAAVDQWFAALNAMFAGKPEPFAELYSHADDVTYMGAEGTYRIGWDAVYDDWKQQAAKSRGGEVHGLEIHVVVDGTMAMATHYTKGTVETAEGQTVDQQVRETSVFRMEDGAWKMIGHQADNYPVWVDVVDQ